MTPEQQTAFYAKVAKTIGIDPGVVARHRGKLSQSVFAASLLASKGKVIDTYDGTQMSDNPTPEREIWGDGPFAHDPQRRAAAALHGLCRKDLGYVTSGPISRSASR